MSRPAEPVDLDRLDALAKAATPGPWRRQTHHAHLDGPGSRMLVPVVRAPWPNLPHGSITIARCGNGNSSTPRPDDSIRQREEANAAFIAALDPATVQHLVARARRAQEAEAEAERLRKLVKMLRDAWYYARTQQLDDLLEGLEREIESWPKATP